MDRFVRLVSPLFLAAIVAVSGCDKGETSGQKTEPSSAAAPAKPVAPLVPTTQIADWCPEHGVPESLCAQCNESLFAGFKEKKDWCNEHSVPESQCFKCHPELKAKFAAEYKTKYGKDAPSAMNSGT